MTWYNANITDVEFESRFIEFIQAQGGERVSVLMPKGGELPFNADFLLWSRTVIAELKCITKNRYHDPSRGDKFLKLYASWVQRGLKPRLPPTPPGQLRRHILNTDGLPIKEQRKAAALFNAPIKTALSQASRQIRATRRDLMLPNSKGLLIMANLADASMSPHSAMEALEYELAQHQNGTIDSFIFISPVADRRFGQFGPHLWMSGTCAGREGVDPALLHELCVAWDAFVSDGESTVIQMSPERLKKWPEPPESRRE